MDLVTMISRCEVRFRDVTNVFVQEIDWKQHLNAAMYEFFQAAAWPFRLTFTDFLLAAGGHSIDLTSDILEHFDSVYDVTGDRMLIHAPENGARAGLPTRMRVFLEERDSHPIFFRLAGDRLNVFPAPSAATHTIRVWHLTPDPGEMTADNDEPPFPVRYHEAVVAGALAKAAADDENPTQAQQWRGEFDAIMQQAYAELSRFKKFDLAPQFAALGRQLQQQG